MINQEAIEKAIIKGLTSELGIPVIQLNQTGKAPPYPYATINVTIQKKSPVGTWGEERVNGNREYYRQAEQVISITIQSDSIAQTRELVERAYQFFDLTGYDYLSANDIVIARMSDITARDNFITIEYEHRSGFDITIYTGDLVIVDGEQIESIELVDMDDTVDVEGDISTGNVSAARIRE